MKNDAEKLKSHWLDYQNTGSFVPLLIFLEFPLAEAKALIFSSNFQNFPYENLIAFAVSSKSDYWAKLAVDWLEQGIPVGEKIVEPLKLMIDSKWASQKTRQSAFRLVKRLEKSDIV